jgi:hypothetical protein
MTTTETTTETTKFRMVYAGTAPAGDSAKKLSQIFYVLDENGAPITIGSDARLLYSFKRGALAGLRPGAVYEFSGTPASVRYSKGMMAVSYLGDKNLVVEWTASDRANRAAFESRERLLSEANQRPLREALDPIRLAYRRAPLASKAQLLADVVAYIVRNS